MAKNFGIEERKIKGILSVGTAFTYKNTPYTVLESGKPTCYKGEPKTDIYLKASCENGVKEFKISYKKENADFIENKMNSERAQLLFGDNWKKIIESSTLRIKSAFLNKPLIYKKKSGRTDKGAFTLGWKFELLNKSNGDFTDIITLSHEQVIDVYAGTNLPDDKKNAFVNGNIIENSGIANCVLFHDNISSAEDIFSNLYTIEEYVDKYPKVYFACKALNYRSAKGKWDGNRPLSVFVDWFVNDGKLDCNLVFDKPLVTKGNAVAENLISVLKKLGIKTDEDVNVTNITDYGIVFE